MRVLFRSYEPMITNSPIIRTRSAKMLTLLSAAGIAYSSCSGCDQHLSSKRRGSFELERYETESFMPILLVTEKHKLTQFIWSLLLSTMAPLQALSMVLLEINSTSHAADECFC
jgi:hypothetical protein